MYVVYILHVNCLVHKNIVFYVYAVLFLNIYIYICFIYFSLFVKSILHCWKDHFFVSLVNSVTVPEKLDYFITKYAEHIHEKWCLEKVISYI